MNRRTTGPLSARPPRRNEGLGGRASGRLPILAAAGGLLLIVILGLLFLFSRCGSSASAYQCVKSPPAPPNGYTYASCEYSTGSTAGKPGTDIAVPLTDRSVTRGLVLYAYDAGAWKPIGPANISSDGR